jgi:molybdate-binding protein
VAALSRNECDLAGFHVPIGAYEPEAVAWYARWLDPARHCLLHVGVRQQGLFVAAGNPLGLTGLADLTRPDVRFVNRQVGSGTRMLLELMLNGGGLSAHDIQGFNSAEFTHSAVAAYIASGMADVGIGVRTAAERFGLDFVPLIDERYFFALPIAALDEALMRHLVAVVQSRAYQRAVDGLPGYNAVETGTIMTLAQAFSLA